MRTGVVPKLQEYVNSTRDCITRARGNVIRQKNNMSTPLAHGGIVGTRSRAAAAAEARKETKCHLLSLPAELRNKIYTHALLPPSSTITFYTHSTLSLSSTPLRQTYLHPSHHYRTPLPPSDSAIPLLRTCKQLNAEAAPIFYGGTQFRFPDPTGWVLLAAWLNSVGAVNRAFVEHVAVVVPGRVNAVYGGFPSKGEEEGMRKGGLSLPEMREAASENGCSGQNRDGNGNGNDNRGQEEEEELHHQQEMLLLRRRADEAQEALELIDRGEHRILQIRQWSYTFDAATALALLPRLHRLAFVFPYDFQFDLRTLGQFLEKTGLEGLERRGTVGVELVCVRSDGDDEGIFGDRWQRPLVEFAEGRGWGVRGAVVEAQVESAWYMYEVEG
ncbi:hypothetical protein K402DRAFT_450177 [Aulographum hederae CBS 113979]|uniref:F-box domain-containing protein n=1 Tax=Aulographum hederae CBS 113979 TaxID=1176131 RepID=A0A6G1HG53_9PEZI|nr:hypothetical protein K402DRAFT_450177 [Aulographum hederae CBS 113979]